MKRLLFLSLIIAAITTVAFVSKPKPPSFVQDMAAFDNYMQSKQTELSEGASVDSAAVFSDIHDEIMSLVNKWDLQDEASRIPNIGLAACRLHCNVVYATCHESSYGTDGLSTMNCYTNYVYCLAHCGMVY